MEVEEVTDAEDEETTEEAEEIDEEKDQEKDAEEHQGNAFSECYDYNSHFSK
jgi:hypothetical protein